MIYNLSNPSELYKFNTSLNLLKSKGATVELTEKKNARTLKQNSSIHLYCEMVADILNELGRTFQYKGIKGVEMDMRYTGVIVKEMMWKPIQNALFDKKSTTELTTKEVSEVAFHIEAFFSNQGVDVPFPSLENLNP